MACGNAVLASLVKGGDVLLWEEQSDVDVAHLLGQLLTVFGVVHAGVAQVLIAPCSTARCL